MRTMTQWRSRMRTDTRTIFGKRGWGRKVVRSLALALAFMLPPVVAGVGSFVIKGRRIVDDRPAVLTAPLPPLPTYDPSRRTAVIVISNHGTEITDSLPHYELLAKSGAFNTYFVAPERRVSPIHSANELPLGIGRVPSGLEILPHFSFADYEHIVGRAPDLIVVPFLTEFVPGSERPIVEWIRAQAGPQTIILSICAGSRVLADTGLLDGHAATGFHRDIPRLRQHYPAVRWQTAVRWVDDGQIVTSGTLTAGIDATLHMIERLAGHDVAEHAAAALDYAHLDRLDDPSADYQPPAAPDLGMVPSYMYRWGQTDMGVVLHEGVSETALAALLDTSVINLTRVYTLAPAHMFVSSRHGMIMAPRWSYAGAPALDRVIVLSSPGDAAARMTAAGWSEQRGRPGAEILASGPGAGFAYDVVIADVTRQEGGAVARSDSVNLVYPVDPALLGGSAWRPRLVAGPLLTGLLGFALVASLTRRWMPRPRPTAVRA